MPISLAGEGSRPEPMNVTVTGAAGFIGSHVAERLHAAGHRVTGIDDLSLGKADNLRPERFR